MSVLLSDSVTGTQTISVEFSINTECSLEFENECLESQQLMPTSDYMLNIWGVSHKLRIVSHKSKFNGFCDTLITE